MRAKTRPKEIDRILTLHPSEATATELEAYIADLESKQHDRPPRIISLLQEVGSCCSAESMVSLEKYIMQLEENQIDRPDK